MASDPTRPRDPGLNGWFALAALVVAIVLSAMQLGVLAGLFVLLAAMWGVIWIVRMRRVVRWAQTRRAAR
jgi:hypothetical protein